MFETLLPDVTILAPQYTEYAGSKRITLYANGRMEVYTERLVPSTPELQAAVDAARAKLLAMLADPEVRLVRAPRANAEHALARSAGRAGAASRRLKSLTTLSPWPTPSAPPRAKAAEAEALQAARHKLAQMIKDPKQIV
jgi:hypothetical protein